MRVLGGPTDPRTDSVSYCFGLADRGEGSLNITHISQPNLDAVGRFKPTSGSGLYIIEGFRKKIKNSAPYRVEKDEGCTVIYGFDLDSLKNPQAKAKHHILCGVEMIQNPFNQHYCSQEMKC